MSFFDEAKHKLEEVAGKVEKFVGEARGDVAMQFEGEAHAEHGEALQEHDDVRSERDEALQENRDEEQARTQAARAEHDQRKLQDSPSGEGMRRAEP